MGRATTGVGQAPHAGEGTGMSEQQAPEGWPDDAIGAIWSRGAGYYPVYAADMETMLWFWTDEEEPAYD